MRTKVDNDVVMISWYEKYYIMAVATEHHSRVVVYVLLMEFFFKQNVFSLLHTTYPVHIYKTVTSNLITNFVYLS